MPRHETIVIHDAVQVVGIGWNVSATGVNLAAYANGYIMEVGLAWAIAGAPGSVPARVRVGISGGGVQIPLMEYTLDQIYTGAGVLSNRLGGSATVRASLRGPGGSPGGQPIGTVITPAVWAADAATVTASPICYLQYVIWRP